MHQNPESKTRIVALGGGTGMTSLLSGLNRHDLDLSAIVTVADDGGSSGRLRQDFDIPPPGDIRNCLVAMSDAEELVGELFQYRFQESFLKGHSFGNLFLVALTELTGDFRQAIEQARIMLSVRGRVIPSTENKVVLVAEHPDGSKSTGEQALSRSGKTVCGIKLVPTPRPISDEISGVLEAADIICLGPGSLYTSIIPNLLIPGMVEAINRSPATLIYIANLMTQPGETDGFDLAAHLDAFSGLNSGLEIDLVLAPSDEVATNVLERYMQEGSTSVAVEPDVDQIKGIPIERLALVDDGQHVRHNPERLADAVLKHAKRRETQP